MSKISIGAESWQINHTAERGPSNPVCLIGPSKMAGGRNNPNDPSVKKASYPVVVGFRGSGNLSTPPNQGGSAMGSPRSKPQLFNTTASKRERSSSRPCGEKAGRKLGLDGAGEVQFCRGNTIGRSLVSSFVLII